MLKHRQSLVPFVHGRIARSGQGLPKVSPGTTMPYPSTPFNGRFRGGLPAERVASGRLLPLRTPHAYAFVTHSDPLCRCLFAQVTSQKFVPDRRSPWRHPPSDAEPHRVKAWDLGMRITCGFEMLCNRRGAAKRRNDTKCDDKIFCDKKGSHEEQRRTFFDSLKRNGFFKGELEGSKHWNELLKKAEEFYQDIVLNEGQDTSEFVSRGVKEKIEKIFEKGECHG
jgi:hypothetical protein